MQHWLSGYANWYAKRNRRIGHLFQGRYKAFLVEDAGYFWSLSRYIHLNPCSGIRPLAAMPDQRKHSSDPGYARKTAQFDRIHYDELHAYWAAANGGKDASVAYRRYVKAGLEKAALLCHRWTGEPLSRLSARFGLSLRTARPT